MKKMTKVSLAVVVLLVTSIIAAGTVWGSNALRKIDAVANDNIKIYYNGDLANLTDTDGSKISPVIINGRTYLPLRAMSELLELTSNGTVPLSKFIFNGSIQICRHSQNYNLLL